MPKHFLIKLIFQIFMMFYSYFILTINSENISLMFCMLPSMVPYTQWTQLFVEYIYEIILLHKALSPPTLFFLEPPQIVSFRSYINEIGVNPILSRKHVGRVVLPHIPRGGPVKAWAPHAKPVLLAQEFPTSEASPPFFSH